MSRDIETTEQLQREGWQVLRFWEHEVPDRVAATIISTVAERRIRS